MPAADRLTHLTTIRAARQRVFDAWQAIIAIDEKARATLRELQLDIVEMSLAEIALAEAELALDEAKQP
jgi:hypothetical protein